VADVTFLPQEMRRMDVAIVINIKYLIKFFSINFVNADTP